MKNEFQIACFQSDISWENIEENLKVLELKIQQINDSTDLIIFPEMFTTGFSMNPEKCFQTMDGKTVSWMKKIAFEKNVAITGSLIIKDQNRYYNRMLFVQPNGEIAFYDKKHLFTLAGENKVYTPGNRKVVINYLGWKICLQICYDLRFPVWSRNDSAYDILVYVANWPKQRISAWDTLLKARAIENMCYTIGVNRVGVDANNFGYVGHTQVLDSLGNVIANSNSDIEAIIESTLNKTELNRIRDKFQFLNDKDSFFIEK